jgi:stage V sporulation protein B
MIGRKEGFLSGVFLLTFSALCTKICGLLFKIPLVSVITDEGMGYFNSAYVIYTFFYVLSTSGLPVGLSILVSKSKCVEEGVAYLRSAVLLFGGMGGIFCLLMALFPGSLALAIGNPGASFSIRVMAPALLAVCLSGCLRGYFQGLKDMMPTAVSQVIESVLKTAFGLLFARFAVKSGYGPAVSAAAGLLGVCLGSVFSFLYLAAAFFFKRREWRFLLKKTVGQRSYYGRLLRVILPIGTASAVLSLSSVIDLAVIIRRLEELGFSVSEANLLYGNYSGTAVPLFNLPAVLVAPIASSVVPYLSGKDDREKAPMLSAAALRLAVLIAAPCAFGLALLAEPILTLLFGKDSAALSAPLLIVLAPAVCFVALETVSGAILQGSGMRKLPVIALAFGAVLKICACYFLMEKWGMAAAPVGTVLCYLAASAINLGVCFKNRLLFADLLKTFFQPVFCAAICGLSALLFYRVMGSTLAVLPLAILLSVPVYLLALLLAGVPDEETEKLFPLAGKIGRIRGKLSFFKKKG